MPQCQAINQRKQHLFMIHCFKLTIQEYIMKQCQSKFIKCTKQYTSSWEGTILQITISQIAERREKKKKKEKIHSIQHSL